MGLVATMYRTILLASWQPPFPQRSSSDLGGLFAGGQDTALVATIGLAPPQGPRLIAPGPENPGIDQGVQSFSPFLTATRRRAMSSGDMRVGRPKRAEDAISSRRRSGRRSRPVRLPSSWVGFSPHAVSFQVCGWPAGPFPLRESSELIAES